jgi:L-ribulose-5-phosphate 3-epimerase
MTDTVRRFYRGYSLVVRDGIDIRQTLPAIARAGFDGIEPTFVAGAIPDPERDHPDALQNAKRLRSICDDLGMAIPSMRGGRVPWRTIPSNDPKERTKAVDHTRRALDLVAAMGGTTLLVVPGERTPDVSYDVHWSRVVEYARGVADFARDYRVRIGFENVEARFPVSVRDWQALIDEIDSQWVGVYLDTGNVLWMGFGYPEHWIRALDHRIVQVHFKDARYRLQGATLHSEIHHILDGDVNWASVMKALNQINYRGWISVEPEAYTYLPERLPERLAADLDAILAISMEEDER